MSAVSPATLVSLSLREFRNFDGLDLEIPERGLALVGENGHGKTNLLEAIYYLSLFRSMRGARDVDLVRFGQDNFFVEGEVRIPDAHLLAVGFERASRRKRVRRDGNVVTRLSEAFGALPVVMFAPTDVQLVAGGPGERRRYLDIMLALSSRGYLDALQQYRAALLRRNAALRDAGRKGRAEIASIAVWEEPLARHGAQLSRARRDWVEQIRDAFAVRASELGESGASDLRYVSGTGDGGTDEDAVRAALESRRHSDLRFGITQCGPHRDDLVMLLNDHDLRSFGSAGQQRTAAIALRTLEAETLSAARGMSPVFLLDDPFAELDLERAGRVLSLLHRVGAGQTILAVPRDTDIPGSLTTLPRRRIARGCIE